MEDKNYYWDLHLNTVGNKYFNQTYDACLFLIQRHNQLLLNYKHNIFSGSNVHRWEKSDDKMEYYVNDKLIAVLIKKDQIENPDKIWRFYREY
jgi:hypothetical protein